MPLASLATPPPYRPSPRSKLQYTHPLHQLMPPPFRAMPCRPSPRFRPPFKSRSKPLPPFPLPLPVTRAPKSEGGVEAEAAAGAEAGAEAGRWSPNGNPATPGPNGTPIKKEERAGQTTGGRTPKDTEAKERARARTTTNKGHQKEREGEAKERAKARATRGPGITSEELKHRRTRASSPAYSGSWEK